MYNNKVAHVWLSYRMDSSTRWRIKIRIYFLLVPKLIYYWFVTVTSIVNFWVWYCLSVRRKVSPKRTDNLFFLCAARFTNAFYHNHLLIRIFSVAFGLSWLNTLKLLSSLCSLNCSLWRQLHSEYPFLLWTSYRVKLCCTFKSCHLLMSYTAVIKVNTLTC